MCLFVHREKENAIKKEDMLSFLKKNYLTVVIGVFVVAALLLAAEMFTEKTEDDQNSVLSYKSALEENGKTIVVLGGGFNHIYPAINNSLARKITENNVVQSSRNIKKNKTFSTPGTVALKCHDWDFPGGPVPSTPCFQCRGPWPRN